MSDIHRETAAAMFRVPLEEVTDEMRARARTINAATLHAPPPPITVTREDASRLHERFHSAYPEVAVQATPGPCCTGCEVLTRRVGSIGASLWSCFTKGCKWFAQRRTLEEITTGKYA